jgi:hypothetical protein
VSVRSWAGTWSWSWSEPCKVLTDPMLFFDLFSESP